MASVAGLGGTEAAREDRRVAAVVAAEQLDLIQEAEGDAEAVVVPRYPRCIERGAKNVSDAVREPRRK